MLIIPAIDISEGKCVRLTQGDYNQKKVYNENPVEVARAFEDAGLTHLHVVDLDGAKANQIVNYKTLRAIVAQTKMKVDFGGGIKNDEAIKMAFEAGANQITAGSIAVKDRELVLKWLDVYGPEKIILGADAKNEMIATHGWQQQSDLNLFDFLSDFITHGVRYAICTDIAKDGMLQGPATALYRKMQERFEHLNIIASGGVSNIEDLQILAEVGVYGAIVGKAIYEGRITLTQLSKLNSAG